MENVAWPFDIEPGTLVVTTTYVMTHREPILYVLHQEDPEEGPIWQFHCGNGDYDSEVLMLVRLDEVLPLDPSLYKLASMPVGHAARRSSHSRQWLVAPEH